ncbi:MAG: ATP-dependent DNA helicase RecG [Candidatus Shapirobacteria bacterium]|nr:ATP-dependent DNA helicase RecG [Candidatus Shapirobacteria bacterium]
MSFSLPGIGPKTLTKLKQLNITSDKELLYHFPHRYVDFSKSIKISQAPLEENVTLSGKIQNISNIFLKNGKSLQKIILSDSTGSIDLVWFNQPYLTKNFHEGEFWTFAGTTSLYHGHPTLFSPEYGKFNTGKIIPIYGETKGLTSRWFRKIFSLHLSSLLKSYTDPLPLNQLTQYKLIPLNKALTQIHLPQNQNYLEKARYRLAFDEINSLLAKSLLQKKSWANFSPKFILKNYSTTKLINSFPFKLTDSQKSAWQEIKTDLISKKKVMNRLLCGDVASGKTVLALLSTYLTSQNQRQSLLLAPTEILAQQHYATFKSYLPTFPIYLLTAKNSLPKTLDSTAIIIATHAAIFQKEKFMDNLALLIIDEQHKFGVKQRSFLNNKNPPHTLTMTATPIPRSISLTLFGNLDLSTLKNLPQKRNPVKTFLVPQNKISDCYQWLLKEIKQKKTQAFIVCPFIEQSESNLSIKSAKKEFEHLRQIFPSLKLELIHGKTKIETRNKILDQFKKNKINILVTTPIIEVGIDFPNATTVIIQSADHFGLSQLHQLRGRVGRGTLQSYCYFFTESTGEKALKRLKYLEKTNDGFKIAEFDLKSRGPGETFSTLQHGFPSLKIASFSDLKLIEFCQLFLKQLQTDNPHFDLKKLVLNQNSLSLTGKHLN